MTSNKNNLGMMSLSDYEVQSTSLSGFLNRVNIRSIRDVDNVTYSIPPYQRGYSWGKDMVEDFLQRIIQTDDVPYYLGLIVLARGEIQTAKNGVTTIDLQIVDGQQRLTTYFLLVHCILRFIHKRYEKRQDTDGTHRILKNNNVVSSSSKDYEPDKMKFSTREYDELFDWYMHPTFNWKSRRVDDGGVEQYNKPLKDKLAFKQEKHDKVWDIIINSEKPLILKGPKGGVARKEEHQTKDWNKIKDSYGIKKGDLRLWETYVQMEEWVAAKWEEAEKGKPGEFDEREFIEMCNRILLNTSPKNNSKLHLSLLVANTVDFGVYIFNQMNSEGLQLGAPDLIKAHIYVVAKKEESPTEVEKFMERWDAIEEKFPVTNSTKNKNFVDFLLYDLYVRKNPDKESTINNLSYNNSNLSACYKEDYPEFEDIEKLLVELERRSDIYIYLKQINSSIGISSHKGLDDVLINMNNCLSSTVQQFPLLMKIFDMLKDKVKTEDESGAEYSSPVFDKNKDNLITITKRIFSYTLRYDLADKPPNRFRNIMNKALDKIRAIEDKHKENDYANEIMMVLNDYFKPNNSIDEEDSVDAAISKISSEGGLIKGTCPSNGQLKHVLANNSLATNKIKGLLKMIESSGNNEFKNSEYDLEHIYPKKNQKWKENESPKDIENLEEVKGLIGNFTILKKSANIKASNHAWIIEKKDKEEMVPVPTKSKCFIYNKSHLKINTKLLGLCGTKFNDDDGTTLLVSAGKFDSSVVKQMTEYYVNKIIGIL